MMGYALVMYCALFVSVQCHLHKKHSDDGPVYDGLNTILNDAREYTQMIADDLNGRYNLTLNIIKEKVDQMKDNNKFTQEIELLKTQDDTVQKCLKDHELAIALFMRKVVTTYDACTIEVKQMVNDFVEKIRDNFNTIRTAPKNVEEIIKECLDQNQNDTNSASSVLCVVTRIAELQENVFEANQSVEKFIGSGLHEVEVYSTKKCDGLGELTKEFETLFEKIQSCVKSAKQ